MIDLKCFPIARYTRRCASAQFTRGARGTCSVAIMNESSVAIGGLCSISIPFFDSVQHPFGYSVSKDRERSQRFRVEEFPDCASFDLIIKRKMVRDSRKGQNTS